MRLRGLCVIRGGAAAASIAARADSEGDDGGNQAQTEGGMPTMVVEYSRFDTWYEIDSFWEGRFLERISRGAFKKTIAERGDQMKVLFNHGFDMYIHMKSLGVPSVLEERETSPYMEVPLLDTSYNRDLVPGLEAGAYGSSFMFEVLADSWNREPERSDHNPEGIPERTVTEVRQYEAGPVTWPANPDATAGLRSGTDWMIEQLQRHDPERAEDLVRSLAGFRAANGLRTPADDGAATPTAPAPETPAPGHDEPARHVDGIPRSKAARERALQMMSTR